MKFLAVPSSLLAARRTGGVCRAERRLLRIGDQKDPVDFVVRCTLNVNDVAAERGVRRPSIASPRISDCVR